MPRQGVNRAAVFQGTESEWGPVQLLADTLSSLFPDSTLEAVQELQHNLAIANKVGELLALWAAADESGDLDFFFHTCIEPYVGRSDDVQVRCV